MKRISLFIIVLLITTSASFSQTADYKDYLRSITTVKDSLSGLYIKADSIKKLAIINYSKEYLLQIITSSIFSCWYNTKWDFNGKTRTPKQGAIACGYFVTTVLYDIGLNIPRIKWAESASEVFIKKMSKQIKRFYNSSIEDVLSYIQKNEDGLYIVGLDCHVGFIYKINDKIKFVHSSYYQPDIGVMEEDFTTKNPLKDSKYRVVGRIFDDQMIIKWLLNQKYI
jgi:hypothetical protein